MIRKLQIKFVAMCMILVTAVLGVVFTAVFFSAKQNIEVISHQVLQRVMEDDTPSGRPDLGLNRGGEDVLLPYFTVNLWDRSGIYEAFVTGGTYSNLQDTQELQTILTDCLQQNRPEGTIHSYGLRYLRRDYGLYERIAFVDMSMEQATLQEIMGSYLQIGLAALLLLLGVSILLARWATRPVAKAWQQQRQFLSDASHELKTPLTVILSNAELLEAAPLEDRPARWADNIRSEAGQMKSLVEEMLTLARADNAVPTAVMGEVSLSDLATDCVLAFEPVAFEAGKPLESDIRPAGPSAGIQPRRSHPTGPAGPPVRAILPGGRLPGGAVRLRPGAAHRRLHCDGAQGNSEGRERPGLHPVPLLHAAEKVSH